MIKKDFDKIKYFGKTIYRCCNLLKIKKPIIVKPDKRFRNCTAEVRSLRNIKTNEEEYSIVYSIKSISEIDYWQILSTVLHELGHIKTKQNGNEFDREYRAEKFAYKAIKKYFGLHLKRYLDYMVWYEMNYNDVYQRVFRKLLKEITK